VLPAKNRLRTSKDFALTTKTGVRATSLSLVVYLKTNSSNQTNANNSSAPLVGLIVNKSVGGSVVRHRVSRQLRHLASTQISNIPAGSRLVIRVLRNQPNYETELNELMSKVVSKIPVTLWEKYFYYLLNFIKPGFPQPLLPVVSITQVAQPTHPMQSLNTV